MNGLAIYWMNWIQLFFFLEKLTKSLSLMCSPRQKNREAAKVSFFSSSWKWKTLQVQDIFSCCGCCEIFHVKLSLQIRRLSVTIDAIHTRTLSPSHTTRWRIRLPLMAINEIKKNLTNIFIFFRQCAVVVMLCLWAAIQYIPSGERWEEMWTNGWCLAVIDLQLCRRFYVFTTKQWVPKIDEKGTQNNCAEQFSAFLAYFIPHLFFSSS